tara:strand:+ start:902 stop:1003 length:102 start_codon:yes stop_codon:yes gene_type:complete
MQNETIVKLLKKPFKDFKNQTLKFIFAEIFERL